MATKYRDYAWPEADVGSLGSETWRTPSPKEDEPDTHRLDSRYPTVHTCSLGKVVWRPVQDTKPRYPLGPRGTLAARCVVESIEGDEARCLVEVEGVHLRVALNAAFLRQHNLSEGMKFLWWMSDDGIVLPQDIDPDVPQTPRLSAEEETVHRQLWEEFQKRIESGEVWEEYTGNGP
jgi:hypothetical protein